MSSFQYLKRWTRPTNYLGKEYTDYFPVYSITRDSQLPTTKVVGLRQ